MAATWVFRCKLGLEQSTCTKREVDKNARGYGQWNGCPSCKHREPGNAETFRAETNASAAE